MKVLVVGHGAREHAMAKSLVSNGIELHAAMSRRNPGIARISKSVEIIDINNPQHYDRFQNVDIAFIGPEAPLATGVTDKLNELGIPVVGPTKAAARLEWSKAYTRIFLDNNGIQGNPSYKICRSLADIKEYLAEHKDVAVKPDVLTGGKGVKITSEHLQSTSEVEEYALERISEDGVVVLEEKLVGNEFTLQAFTDGKTVEVMPLVRDYKRAYDGDKGPNTGSMGSYSCVNHRLHNLSKGSVETGQEIMKLTIESLAANGIGFKGILYGGFMETSNGVYLLEYNVRLGDPEAMNVLSLLKKPLIDIGWEIVDGRLGSLGFQEKATVCVYLVPHGYPNDPKKDRKVIIKEPIKSELFFASVHEENGQVRTTGSRAIALLAKGSSVSEAREKVYSDIPEIKGELFYRKDIGLGIP